MAPEKVVWAQSPNSSGVGCFNAGFIGDRFYRPMKQVGDMVEFTGSAASIDPLTWTRRNLLGNRQDAQWLPTSQMPEECKEATEKTAEEAFSKSKAQGQLHHCREQLRRRNVLGTLQTLSIKSTPLHHRGSSSQHTKGEKDNRYTRASTQSA